LRFRHLRRGSFGKQRSNGDLRREPPFGQKRRTFAPPKAPVKPFQVFFDDNNLKQFNFGT
jgi:hypothetical protein